MSRAFRAVLFDWRGTLFHDEDEADWIRASAASIGRALTSDEVNALVEMGFDNHPTIKPV
jgi:FMN phosphatase YigB (HAD superfamily)